MSDVEFDQQSFRLTKDQYRDFGIERPTISVNGERKRVDQVDEHLRERNFEDYASQAQLFVDRILPDFVRWHVEKDGFQEFLENFIYYLQETHKRLPWNVAPKDIESAWLCAVRVVDELNAGGEVSDSSATRLAHTLFRGEMDVTPFTWETYDPDIEALYMQRVNGTDVFQEGPLSAAFRKLEDTLVALQESDHLNGPDAIRQLNSLIALVKRRNPKSIGSNLLTLEACRRVLRRVASAIVSEYGGKLHRICLAGLDEAEAIAKEHHNLALEHALEEFEEKQLRYQRSGKRLEGSTAQPSGRQPDELIDQDSATSVRD